MDLRSFRNLLKAEKGYRFEREKILAQCCSHVDYERIGASGTPTGSRTERISIILDALDIEHAGTLAQLEAYRQQLEIEALQLKDPEQKAVILNYYGRGQTVKQIAENLSIPEKRVFSKLMEAEKKLNEER